MVHFLLVYSLWENCVTFSLSCFSGFGADGGKSGYLVHVQILLLDIFCCAEGYYTSGVGSAISMVLIRVSGDQVQFTGIYEQDIQRDTALRSISSALPETAADAIIIDDIRLETALLSDRPCRVSLGQWSLFPSAAVSEAF
jgi:hypothetical protein